MQRLEGLHYKETDHSRQLGNRTVNWTMRDPEESTVNEIGLVVPGIMAKRRLYSPYANETARRGFATATMAHEGASTVCPDEVMMVARDLSETYQKKVRLIGHSLGGIHATLAAREQPDNISGLLLMQPAGYGGVRPLHMLSSLLERPDNSHISHEICSVYDAVQYVRASPPDQLARAALTASRRWIVEEAASLPAHIQKDALLFPDDKLISAEKIKVGLARAGFSWYELDSELHAGHNAIMYRDVQVAEATLAIINDPFVLAA